MATLRTDDFEVAVPPLRLVAPAPPPPTAMARVHALADRAARSRISVLITGETGVGKEVLARRVHEGSARARGPFVALNCAALCETLVDAELFGNERGAFTGAGEARPGLIEAADGGTLFLDEVGEMPLAVQAKLLRAIETREVLRIGARRGRVVDVRFVAATNRHLEVEVAQRRFREDLLYRLDGIRLDIPPLRERTDEIPALARDLLAQASAGAEVPALGPRALAALAAHGWPGNIRELRNVIERAVLMCDGGTIELEHLQLRSGGPSDAGGSERERILSALAACAGNQTRTARVLGMSRRTLITRLDELAIPRPQKA